MKTTWKETPLGCILQARGMGTRDLYNRILRLGMTIDETNLSKWRNGSRRLSEKDARKIGRALRVSMSLLLGEPVEVGPLEG